MHQHSGSNQNAGNQDLKHTQSECRRDAARFNPKTSTLSQKCHPYSGNLNSETSGDSKTRFCVVEMIFQENTSVGLLVWLSGHHPKAASKALCLPKLQVTCKAAMQTGQTAASDRHAASPGLQQPLPATTLVTLHSWERL